MQQSRSIGVADVAREAGDLIADVVSRLPALPPVIRYYDEFDDATRSITAPADSDGIRTVDLWAAASGWTSTAIQAHTACW